MHGYDSWKTCEPDPGDVFGNDSCWECGERGESCVCDLIESFPEADDIMGDDDIPF